MNRPSAGLAATIVALIVATTACGDDEPSRSDVLEAFGADVAGPVFEDFAGATATLTADTEAVCESPGEATVAVAVATIDATRRQWLASQAVWTGPVMERRSEAVVDWPVEVDDVEALIDRSEPGGITPDVVGNNVGADTRGLSAMRYVLTGDDVLQRLQDERWCDYLQSAATVIADEAGLLVGDWTESWDDGPAFVDVLGDGAATEEWLGMLVNNNIFLVHQLTEAPEDAGEVDPADPAGDRAATLAGIAGVAEALGPLLGSELSDRLDAEIAAARSAYADGDVEVGRVRTAEVEATLATEVASRLDVTIGFSDADGDSAG